MLSSMLNSAKRSLAKEKVWYSKEIILSKYLSLLKKQIKIYRQCILSDKSERQHISI